MTRFYLIRHAERLGDPQLLAGRMPGWPLTPRGRAQAERLARELAGEPIRHVFSSPVERARATAEPIARRLGLTVMISPAINEIDFGEWTGKTWRELEADERWRRFNRERAGAQAPGGESIAAVQARFIGAMNELRDAFPRAGIALVSHADPIRLALAHCRGLPIESFDGIEIATGSVTVVDYYADRAAVAA
jgi:probable phosphoglycerate mutase